MFEAWQGTLAGTCCLIEAFARFQIVFLAFCWLAPWLQGVWLLGWLASWLGHFAAGLARLLEGVWLPGFVGRLEAWSLPRSIGGFGNVKFCHHRIDLDYARVSQTHRIIVCRTYAG